jgi:type II secretory pathway component GspD/PulD (secretin)
MAVIALVALAAGGCATVRQPARTAPAPLTPLEMPPQPPLVSVAQPAAPGPDVASASAIESTSSMLAAPPEGAAVTPPADAAAGAAELPVPPVDVPEMPGIAPAEGAAAPGEAEGAGEKPVSQVDEQFLRAVLESQQSQMATVQQRISYPDELLGGALVKSAKKPGEVTFFYPLKAVGGVTVEISKDHTVKINPASEASVKPLVDTLTKYLEPNKEKVAWYPTRNMLEINALEENMPFILDLLEFLDAPDEQIMIEAGVWEITDVQDTQLGSRITSERRTGGGSFFNMFDTRFDTQAFIDTLTSGQPYQGSTLEFVTAASANHAKMGVVFQFLKNLGHADLVSKPRMRVSVGQTAKIMTGEQVPIQSVKLISGRLELGGSTVYKDVGVQLYVTPMIAGPESITVSVLPIVSEVIGYSDPGPNGVANPIIASREAQTEVTVANKELITIGGLTQTKTVVSESKVPLLGDIPLLGYFFKSRREQSKKVELWFTVQPTIADDRIVTPETTGTSSGAAGPR